MTAPPSVFRPPVITPAPHRRSVRSRIGCLLLALLPGICLQGLFYGPAVLLQIGLASVFALTLEIALGRLLKPPRPVFPEDLSALVTATLFAISIPPLAPWWITAIGMFAAIGIAKQLYGGLGMNLFNPAMVGVATVTLGFALDDRIGWMLCSPGATWVVLAYAMGGLWLVGLRIVPWQIPLATLGSAVVVSLLAWLISGEASLGPLAQLGSGTLVLAAFFIASEPVTGCSSARGRLAFGAGVGLLTLAIRYAGDQADGVALAVLAMNALARGIDRLAQPPRRQASRS